MRLIFQDERNKDKKVYFTTILIALNVYIFSSQQSKHFE